jgi:hypothetical protein
MVVVVFCFVAGPAVRQFVLALGVISAAATQALRSRAKSATASSDNDFGRAELFPARPQACATSLRTKLDLTPP